MNPQSEIQLILRQRFSEIKSRNPRFSVRAFARQLGLQASATNEIMKGQRNISRAMAEKLLDRLNLSSEQRMSISDANATLTTESFAISKENLKSAMEVMKRAKWEVEKLSTTGEEKRFEFMKLKLIFLRTLQISPLIISQFDSYSPREVGVNKES